jgi:hypothetical protein
VADKLGITIKDQHGTRIVPNEILIGVGDSKDESEDAKKEGASKY